MANSANLAYFRTEQAKYDALLTRDPYALYFCTDTMKLYRGDVDFSANVRDVVDHSTLLTPARNVLYVEPTGAGWTYLKNAEGVDAWKQVINPAGTGSNVVIVTTIDENSTDDVVPSAKAVWTLFESVDKTPIDLSDYAKKDEVSKTLESYALKQEIKDIADKVDYEIFDKPLGTLVNLRDKEIRVMCPADTEWVLRESGENSDATMYYIGFKSFAPFGDVVSFKEDLNEIITDDTMYYFEDNDFAGVDEYGRRYSVVWLPVAKYDEVSDTWTYYGSNSSAEHFVGWYYSVEWYNSNGVKVASDTIRINLSNEDCHSSVVPYFMSDYVSDAEIADMTSDIEALKKATTWGELS